MSYDPSLYRTRPEVKQAIKNAGLTQPEMAARLRMVPSTLSGKLNGSIAMDASEEAAILAATEKALKSAGGPA